VLLQQQLRLRQLLQQLLQWRWLLHPRPALLVLPRLELRLLRTVVLLRKELLLRAKLWLQQLRLQLVLLQSRLLCNQAVRSSLRHVPRPQLWLLRTELLC
jgi:hypothetical protein